MALPNNALSTSTVSGKLQYPGELLRTPILDYEIGGPTLQVAVQAQRSTLWRATYDGNNIMASSGGPAAVIVAAPNLTYLAFGLDNSMRTVTAWNNGDGKVYLNFYDGTLPGYTTVSFVGDNPQCGMDDNRFDQTANADVILTYTRAGILYMRMQRDRYLTEYALGATPGVGVLAKQGMNTHYRMEFIFSVDGEYGS